MILVGESHVTCHLTSAKFVIFFDLAKFLFSPVFSLPLKIASFQPFTFIKFLGGLIYIALFFRSENERIIRMFHV